MTVSRYTLFEWAKRKGYTLKILSDVEKGWIACAIDGEGSLVDAGSKHDGTVRYTIRVYNTELDYLNRTQEYAGCGIIFPHSNNTSRFENHVPCYVLQIHRIPEVVNILSQVAPLLAIKEKRDRAEAMLKEYRDGITISTPSKEPVSFAGFLMAETLRRTAIIVQQNGLVTANDVAQYTRRSRRLECFNLSRLTKIGYVGKERVGHKECFYHVVNNNER
jgi:hypothetical protein